jgi:hypothetical protein
MSNIEITQDDVYSSMNDSQKYDSVFDDGYEDKKQDNLTKSLDSYSEFTKDTLDINTKSTMDSPKLGEYSDSILNIDDNYLNKSNSPKLGEVEDTYNYHKTEGSSQLLDIVEKQRKVKPISETKINKIYRDYDKEINKQKRENKSYNNLNNKIKTPVNKYNTKTSKASIGNSKPKVNRTNTKKIKNTLDYNGSVNKRAKKIRLPNKNREDSEYIEEPKESIVDNRDNAKTQNSKEKKVYGKDYIYLEDIDKNRNNKLDLNEANEHYRDGSGKAVVVPGEHIEASPYPWAEVITDGEIKKISGVSHLEDYLVHGQVTINPDNGHIYDGDYDFEMHDINRSQSVIRQGYNILRNSATMIGKIVASEGKPYEIKYDYNGSQAKLGFIPKDKR